MSELFLLPCPCGKLVPVSPAQAGSQIICSCGAAVDLPKMREIRSLQRAGAPQASGKKEKNDVPYSGVTPARAFFAICLSIAFIATFVAALLAVQVWQFRGIPSFERERQMDAETVDKLSITDSLGLWTNFKTNGLSGAASSPLLELRQKQAQVNAGLKAAMMIAGLGFISAFMTARLVKGYANV